MPEIEFNGHLKGCPCEQCKESRANYNYLTGDIYDW